MKLYETYRIHRMRQIKMQMKTAIKRVKTHKFLLFIIRVLVELCCLLLNCASFFIPVSVERWPLDYQLLAMQVYVLSDWMVGFCDCKQNSSTNAANFIDAHPCQSYTRWPDHRMALEYMEKYTWKYHTYICDHNKSVAVSPVRCFCSCYWLHKI